jgi:NAD(P)H dehydrogenase (quinone)
MWCTPLSKLLHQTPPFTSLGNTMPLNSTFVLSHSFHSPFYVGTLILPLALPSYLDLPLKLCSSATGNSLYQDVMIPFVLEDGSIRGPAGKGKLCPIARQDIAHFSSKILEDAGAHKDKTYTLTGPEDLGLEEIASTIGRLQDRKVQYIDETDQEARESRASYNAPEWLLDGEQWIVRCITADFSANIWLMNIVAWISTYTAIRTGEMGGANDVYSQITGQSPTRFEDFVKTQVKK